MKTPKKGNMKNSIILFAVLLLVFNACKKDRKAEVTDPKTEPKPGLTLQFTGTTNLSEARFDLAAVSAGDKLFFAGGEQDNGYSDKIDIYDITTNTLTPSLLSLSSKRGRLTAVAANNQLFFAGGHNAEGYKEMVDIYDVQSNQLLVPVSVLSKARVDIASAATGSKVVFAGGFSKGFVSDKVDIYDLITKNFVANDHKLKVARRFLSAAAAGNKIVFAGGQDDHNNSLDAVDIYDVKDGI